MILQTVSDIISNEVKDPRIGSITILSVSSSSDLKNATIYFTVHGGENAGKENAKILNHASGFIQKQLSDRLRLRYTPRLHFKYDPFIDRMERIDTLLKENNE